MYIEPFGELTFELGDQEWYGVVAGLAPHKVELSISRPEATADLASRVELVRVFAADYECILTELHRWAYLKYKATPFEKTLAEIEQMYFLSSVELKADNSWWVVLEPANVPSVYSHLLRFTLNGRKVVWANFSPWTTGAEDSPMG